jgi:hypothetical protein
MVEFAKMNAFVNFINDVCLHIICIKSIHSENHSGNPSIVFKGKTNLTLKTVEEKELLNTSN